MGHPATWNDKTILLFDPLICNVKDGVIPDNFKFILFERNLERNSIKVPYIGVWFMVDNGYLSWSCTVPQIKNGTIYEEIKKF